MNATRHDATQIAAAMRGRVSKLKLANLTMRALREAGVTSIARIYDLHVIAGGVKGFKGPRIAQLQSALRELGLPQFDHPDGAIGHVLDLAVQAGIKTGIEQGIETGRIEGRTRRFVLGARNGGLKLEPLAIKVARALAARRRLFNPGPSDLHIPELKACISCALPIQFLVIQMAELIDRWMSDAASLPGSEQVKQQVQIKVNLMMNDIWVDGVLCANLCTGINYLEAYLPAVEAAR